MKVFSYRNLHKDCFSVRNETTGRVAYRENSVCISDAVFVVGKKGREAVLRTKHKNVHAGVRGQLCAIGAEALDIFKSREGWVEVYYNPYKTSTFVVKETGESVRTAKLVVLDQLRAYALLVESEP